MKRKVVITFEIDALEYYDATDTPAGVIDIAEDILNGNADFPPDAIITISCDGETEEISLD